MLRIALISLVVAAGCASESSTAAVRWHADARCGGPPPTARPTGYRHLTNHVASDLGDPRHRGYDLIVGADAPEQLLRGDLAYDAFDKAIEDEDVEVYACTGGAWRLVGQTRSDGEGRWKLALTGAARLPPGLHDLVVSLPADRSGATATAYVAHNGEAIFVCDIDGTLTESENAIIPEVIFHDSVSSQPGAGAALSSISARGYQPVYLTARPNRYAELTRRWLASKGLPRGPVILQTDITMPGDAALTAKKHALEALRATGVRIAFGIGNRATDITAYGHAGLTAERIWIEDTQYASEIDPLVAKGLATAFKTYQALELQSRRRTW
jgi:phosphatidate phosphatase PAH1